MKIFISYGHNDHTALVDAVFDALRQAGHEPWKDDRYEGISGIPAGADFTNVIYDAIEQSDFVLAFVTAKTAESRYCKDERQYAYDHKASRFIQLRLDGIRIRLGNAGSYVDMDACENHNGTLNFSILQQKLEAIFAALRNLDSLVSPSYKFEKFLRTAGALPYEEFISMPEQTDFVGRQWLKQTCISWITDDTIACRLFVILGDAGTGKTAFVRHLAADRQLVRSVHVCIYDRPVTRNLRSTLKDLAYTLTTTNPAYHDYLKSKNFDQLEQLDHDGLFEFLFLEPLKNETEKYLLIIDGLDEMEENTGLKPLIQLLRQYAHLLNPNISILVTGRPDDLIVSKLRTVPGATPGILLSQENSREDLICYIDSQLTALGYDPKQWQQKLLHACDGNFEYLTLLFRELREENLQLSHSTALPRGLSERYTQYLDRRMEKYNQAEAFTKEQKLLLSLLCVAYEPMPLSLLEAVTGIDEEDIADILQVFGSLITKLRADGQIYYTFFSKGFRDYLLSGEFDNYHIRSKRGTDLFAQYILKNCTCEADLARSAYLDRHSFTHLLLYMEREPEAVIAYLEAMLERDLDQAELRLTNALCSGETAAVEAYFSRPETKGRQDSLLMHLHSRREIGVMSMVCDIYRKNGLISEAELLKADILLMNLSPQALQAAEEICRQLLPQHLADYQANPCYQTGRELYQIYDKLSYILSIQHMPQLQQQAQQLRTAALTLAETNYRENPCFDSRYDLADCYQDLGNSVSHQDSPTSKQEAKVWYQKALAMSRQNYQERPCQRSRSALAIAYSYLGTCSAAASDSKSIREAIDWYQQAIALSEELYKQYPTAENQNLLTVCYDQLGSLYRKQNVAHDPAEAKKWHLRAAALAEQSYQTNPCYDSRLLLATACERLGDIAMDQGAAGLEEAGQWYLRAIPLAEENCRENPGHITFSTLAFLYMRLAEVVCAQKGSDWLNQADHWYKKALLYFTENYRAAPNESNRQGVVVCLLHLANIAESRLADAGLDDAEHFYTLLAQLAEMSYRENPSAENREFLSDIYTKIGTLIFSRGRQEEAFQWLIKRQRLQGS